eukprot:scpid63938/ scgid18680/ Casein kinase I isoform alpha; CK1 &gt; Casein kinase I isoform alpha; CK1
MNRMASKHDHNGRLSDLVIGEKYKIIRKVGSGSFGEIYIGVNTTNGEEIAIKIESPYVGTPQLLYESKVLKLLKGGVGIPHVRWVGHIGSHGIAMVMDLLGPSLEDLFNFCMRRFSNKTVLMLADQLISRVEYVHSKHFLHRDIKPDNFLMGIGRHCNKVFIIDFGLAKKYRSKDGTGHIPYREDKDLIGTARYASINSHLGIEQSRRDDVESLGYVFVYFNRGVLPWMGLAAGNRQQKYDRISSRKMGTPVEVLTRGFPAEYGMYLNYCRGLRFEDQPDYMYLRQLFRILFRTLNYQYDFSFDWTILKQKAASSKEGKEEAGRTSTGAAAGFAAAAPGHDASGTAGGGAPAVQEAPGGGGDGTAGDHGGHAGHSHTGAGGGGGHGRDSAADVRHQSGREAADHAGGRRHDSAAVAVGGGGGGASDHHHHHHRGASGDPQQHADAVGGAPRRSRRRDSATATATSDSRARSSRKEHSMDTGGASVSGGGGVSSHDGHEGSKRTSRDGQSRHSVTKTHGSGTSRTASSGAGKFDVTTKKSKMHEHPPG